MASRSTSEERVAPQSETRDVEVEGDIGTLSGVQQGQTYQSEHAEVEVDEILDTRPVAPQGPQMVVIRVNEPIENMTVTHHGRRESYTFEAGKRYRVPVYIAAELEATGRLWH